MIDVTVAELEAVLSTAAPASATVRTDREAIPRDERSSVLVRPASEAPNEELETLRAPASTELVEVLCVATSWAVLYELVRGVRQSVAQSPGLDLRWTGTTYERQRGGDPPRFEALVTYERLVLGEA